MSASNDSGKAVKKTNEQKKYRPKTREELAEDLAKAKAKTAKKLKAIHRWDKRERDDRLVIFGVSFQDIYSTASPGERANIKSKHLAGTGKNDKNEERKRSNIARLERAFKSLDADIAVKEKEAKKAAEAKKPAGYSPVGGAR